MPSRVAVDARRRRAPRSAARARSRSSPSRSRRSCSAWPNAVSLSTGSTSRPSSPSKKRMIGASSSTSALMRRTPAWSANVDIGLPIGPWIHEQPRSTGMPPRSRGSPARRSGRGPRARRGRRPRCAARWRRVSPAQPGADDDHPLGVAGQAARDSRRCRRRSVPVRGAANALRASRPASGAGSGRGRQLAAAPAVTDRSSHPGCVCYRSCQSCNIGARWEPAPSSPRSSAAPSPAPRRSASTRPISGSSTRSSPSCSSRRCASSRSRTSPAGPASRA